MENPDYFTVHFADFLHSFSVSLHWSMVRKLLAEPFSSRDGGGGGGGPVTEPTPCPPRYQMNMPPDIEDIMVNVFIEPKYSNKYTDHISELFTVLYSL
jgi:hypothetical protein